MHPRITGTSQGVQLLIRTINEELQDIRDYGGIQRRTENSRLNRL